MSAISNLKPIEEMDKQMQKLVRLTMRARRKAYAPYSKFLVGCVLVDGKGRVHTGCNVENVSYSATICAERTAIGKMVSRGVRDCRVVIVVTSSEEPCFPCGVCLQVIHEFGRRAVVVAVNRRGTSYREAVISSLLPSAFVRENLRTS